MMRFDLERLELPGLPVGLSQGEALGALGGAVAFVQGIRLAVKGLDQLMRLLDRIDDHDDVAFPGDGVDVSPRPARPPTVPVASVVEFSYGRHSRSTR